MAVSLHKWCLARCVRPVPCVSAPRCPGACSPYKPPLRMEMKGVGNEFLSARIPDLTAIKQLRGENQREGGREKRDGGQRWRQEETPGKTQSFFSSFFFLHPPLLVPGCQAATMLSWSFFQSVGNREGPPHGGRGEGDDFGERWRRRRTKRRGEKIGLKTKTKGKTLRLEGNSTTSINVNAKGLAL